MLKNHEKFHSANGKRTILVADDEQINRAILGAILENDFEVLYAENGKEALEILEENREIISVVLLDLMMPVMSGMDLLRHLKEEPELQRIPVIVLTSDQTAEIECLSLGAIDFISKPYPQAGVILARVTRIIELSEDQQIIHSTERDPLTGLYNREYFYRYAEQFDQFHKEMDMDAIVLDVNHFHMINERYGKHCGDDVLRRVGESVRNVVRESGGIVCRRSGDTFMVYCPHREDYRDILENASVSFTEDASSDNRVRLRMGVYSRVDKVLDIERRFDRAKSASDTVRGSFAKTIGFYDSAMLETELYEERLVEDFSAAIRQEQFTVFYQPKFNVRSENPVLSSAEALVRWQHPELGMISPAVFIPLFENNGLIQKLDTYVWQHAAAQIRDWKDRLGVSVPISVNVSRIDMYDPGLVEEFQALLKKYELLPGEFLLEITESAYTQDSAQIISTVKRLRNLGFMIEMDDFGTGYSSLNMISSLPIDALKLDMKFIRDAFRDGKDTRLIELIIDIADYLNVPVIAEGVETEEQLNALRAMGCEIVQGYYFSRPVPAVEFERFLKG
ncbi:MAG: EAL domain-containing protein [Clostridia bacterium]|nr:EAL domain-containing protein [Clostridia bacterium]